MTKRLSSHTVTALLIFLAALAVRWVVASPGFDQLFMGGAYTADSPRYERLALTLLREGVYEAHPYTYYAGLERELYTGPEMFRVPGYPLFLAIVFGIAGYSTVAALVVQVFVSALTCVLVYVMGVQLGRERAGLIAAVLLIARLEAGRHAGQITSEVVFTFLLVLCLVGVIAMWKRPGPLVTLATGLAFVAVGLTRPLGMHLGLIFAVVLLTGAWLDRRAWLPYLVPFLCVVVALQAWSWRNYQHTGVWAVTSNDGVTIGLWYPAVIWSRAHNVTYRDGELEVLKRLAQRRPEYEQLYRDASASPLDQYFWRYSKVHDIRLTEALKPVGYEVLLEVWPTTVVNMASGAAWSLFSGMGEWRNWVLSRADYDRMAAEVMRCKLAVFRLDLPAAWEHGQAVLGYLPPLAMLVFVLSVAVLAVTLIGIGLAVYPLLAQTGPIGWLLVLWSGYLLVTAAPDGNNRYLAPLLPLFSLMAGIGLAGRRQRAAPA